MASSNYLEETGQDDGTEREAAEDQSIDTAVCGEHERPSPTSSAYRLHNRGRRHLWDPLRISNARVFASNTSRLLSISRSMSISQSVDNAEVTDCIASQSSGVTDICPSQEKDNEMSSAVGDIESSCESLEEPDLTQLGVDLNICETPPVKTKCLKLIDRIWKGGLDYNLEQIRQRNRSMSHQESLLSSDTDCLRCTRMKDNIGQEFSVNSVHSETVCDMDLILNTTDANKVAMPCDCRRDEIENLGELTKREQLSVSDGSDGHGSLQDSTMFKHSSSNSEESICSPCSAQTSTANSVLTIQSTEIKPDLPKIGADSICSPPFKKARFSWQVKNKTKSKLTSVGTTPAIHRNSDSESNDTTNDVSSILKVTHVSAAQDPSNVNHSQNPSDRKHTSDENMSESPNNESMSGESISAEDCSLAGQNNQCQSEDELLGACLNDDDVSKQGLSRKLEPSPRQPKSSPVSREPGTGLPERMSTESYPVGQRRPSPRDFHMLTQALTELNYVERWQCQHVAKAIVDNAINKTLEEMGLSPSDAGTPYSEQRSRMEDAGISEAILSRGLQRYDPSSYRMRRLSPIIYRLTRVSEHLFSENLRGAMDRSSQNIHNADGRNTPTPDRIRIPSDLMELYINFEDSLSSSSDSETSPQRMTDISYPLETFQNDASEPVNDSVQDSPDDCHTEHMNTGPALDDGDMIEECTATVLKPPHQPYKDDTAHAIPLMDDPNSNFILDQAVNAVICERGLHFP